MSYLILAFYMFWAGAAGEHLSRKYPESSVFWVLAWSLIWPVRAMAFIYKITAGAR